jgi:RNA-directed DNA polymerase
VEAKSAEGVKKLYQVVRTSAIGIKRHIKIKAAANPYLPEYARYIWERRHRKGSKELAAFTAREFRAMVAAS